MAIQSKFKIIMVKINGLIKLVSAIVLVLVLAGCASSGGTLQYYLLHATSPAHVEQKQASNRDVSLTSISLPNYLKQRGLVFQTSDTNLHIATDHLWAEPLDEGITKALTNALSPYHVSIVADRAEMKTDMNALSLHIDDFIATWEGDIILRGQFHIVNALNNTQHKHDFYYVLPLHEDGFAGSVKVMRKAIDQLAQDIAKNIHKA